MPYLDEVWVRKAHAALRATLDVDEHTKKQMIQFLYDEGFWDPESLTWEAAQARFNDNSNPAKKAFWKLGELWALMLRFQRTTLVEAMAESMGFELRPVPTEERRHALLQRAIDDMERLALELAETRGEIERLCAAPLERPLAALPGRRPHFSKEPTAVGKLGSP